MQFTFANNELITAVSGSYQDNLPLANITITGISSKHTSVNLCLKGKQQDTHTVKLSYSNTSALHITGLEKATAAGVWNGELKVTLL